MFLNIITKTRLLKRGFCLTLVLLLGMSVQSFAQTYLVNGKCRVKE